MSLQFSFALMVLVGTMLSFPEAASANTSLDLKTVEQVIPGKSTKGQVKDLLGPPNEITDLNKMTAVEDERGELWRYRMGKETRLTVFFSNQNQLVSWTWHVPESAREANLKFAIERYGTVGEWENDLEGWVNPHAYPNECYFKNSKSAILITYNRARNEVFAITKRDPNRNPATILNDKPPSFCIGSTCSPGISAQEFFKDFPISKYCALPK
ncbi:MAG: hypothetical protein HYR96_00300 [Deltaproteobacteria bacterium]|nr:hypothetical protein [Deltaproteobacteria bacterium]MBI3294770.1 hypothetical protein [Deltaproteobacteria bacterium]